MADYPEMYAALFNAITEAVKILADVQAEAERIYIENETENPGSVIPFPGRQ